MDADEWRLNDMYMSASVRYTFQAVVVWDVAWHSIWLYFVKWQCFNVSKAQQFLAIEIWLFRVP